MNAPNASGWRPDMGSGSAAQVETTSGDRALALEEALIFELGRPGTCGVDLDAADRAPLAALAGHLRKAAPALPGLTEPETVRHYPRLSRQNYGIDLGPFPLGSCTMKHNPRLNEKMARLPGFADVHPLQPQDTVRGAYEAMHLLADWLTTLTGMAAVAMSPKAG
ncbi:MAG TPA: aminomethyl-transferring glycine dehydrogenase subunit GcvPB, partial [Novosphingobium sp.]|nr:aminomethyl-transferring glycine dehydrogenase subunit GcvPB [Novosphingobium sp.]